MRRTFQCTFLSCQFCSLSFIYVVDRRFLLINRFLSGHSDYLLLNGPIISWMVLQKSPSNLHCCCIYCCGSNFLTADYILYLYSRTSLFYDIICKSVIYFSCMGTLYWLTLRALRHDCTSPVIKELRFFFIRDQISHIDI